MNGKSVASPVSTGGGGEQFEQHVAALALGLLLVRGIPPVLTDTSVAEVHLQTRHLGWHTDDLLVIGERSDESRRQLALQVKRSFRVSVGDADCRKTILGMWNDFRSDRFDASQDQLAVATLHGTSVLLRDLVSLLECARASIDAEDFGRRLELDGFVSKRAKEHNRNIRQILIDQGVESLDEDLYWRFLRVISVLSFDLNTATAQTEAWMLSLLTACSAYGSGSNEAARAAWATLLQCVGKGRPAAKSYARGDLPPELRRRHTPVSAADRSGLTVLVEHGQTVRDGIRLVVGDGYTIERSTQVQALAAKLAVHQVVIVSGVAGSGKSAMARELLAQLEDRYPVLSFQAVEFATAHVDQTLANAQTSLNLQQLIALLAGHDRKVVLVDGVERLLECSVRDGFSQLLQLTRKDPSTQIVLTVRDYSLETVLRALIPAELNPEIFEVPALTDAELDAVGDGVQTLKQALGNAPLRAFLRTPYLVDLASWLRWEEAPFPASLREFRQEVWRKLIRDDGHAGDGMPMRRERAFLDIAWRRAMELRPFVAPCVDDPGAVEALSRDSLVTTSPNSSSVYAVTHDVLEDWGVLRLIDDQFEESEGSPRALEQAVGGRPAIRRGVRQWLAERFEMDAGNAQALVFRVIEDEGLEAYFRDDCLVAALRSESAAGFVDACRLRIVRGDFDLLYRVTHVLRVACKESPKWLDVPGLPSQMLVPTGGGWAPTLRLVLDLIDELLPKHGQIVLGLVEDWASQIGGRNTAPAGVAAAGAIVDRLLQEFEGYGSRDARERTLKVVTKIPGVVAQFKDLMERARTCGHEDRIAFGLFELVAAKLEGGCVCREFPNEVTALLDARLRLSDADRERNRSLRKRSILGINHRFGVRRLPIGSYNPPSAWQGPFLALLGCHPTKAVRFILRLLNHAGRSYAAEQRLGKISLSIPNGGTVEQWANGSLYGLYRGTNMGPNSIVSLLMALESWLLSLGEMDGDVLEGWLLRVLRNSNNVMATGVVASVCVAYPDKAGKAGLALLSSREIVQLDRERLALEYSSAFEIGFGLDPRRHIFERERLASNKLPHRRKDLESLAVGLHFGKDREEVWSIIDRHRERERVSAESGEDTRAWRLALHRMDVRGYEPQNAPEGVDVEDSEVAGDWMYFGPGKAETDVQEKVDETARSASAIERFLRLENLGRKVWERDASVGDVEWRTRLLAEARAVERELDEPMEFLRDGPGFAAAVCIRDHLDELDEGEFEWCAKRVDFEVRRKSGTTDPADRSGKLFHADRACASVVPLLAVHPVQAVGTDATALLSLALTHPINQVSEYAFGGVGAFLGEEHKSLALQCAAAAAYRSRLALAVREARRHRRAAGIDGGPDPFASIVPAVRQGIKDRTLNPEEELRLLDFGSPVRGAAVRALLAVFERRPDWKESRWFYSRVARWLVGEWRDGARGAQRRSRNYELESDALRLLAGFVLRLPEPEAVQVSAPVVEAVANQRQEVEHFVAGLIMYADGNSDDCFWELWQRLADAIARSPWGQGLKDETLSGLGLLHMIFLGPYWKEDAKQWHRLEGHAYRLDELASSLPATVPVMRAYTDYLSRVGHGSLPKAFEVVGQVVGKGDGIRIASDSSVAFNLETLLRPFVYSQPHRIKTDPPLREAVLNILDALVAGRSASAYRMRDDFVTPSSG